MAKDKQPIIVKKIIKKHGGHHGGSWKVAYADFMTSMLALFIVLWIMSQSPDFRKAVASYFSDPTGVPAVLATQNALASPGGGVGDYLPIPAKSGNSYKAEQEIKKLAKVGKNIQEKLLSQPDLSSISDMIQVTMTPDGLRIEISDRKEGTFFDIGDAMPKEKLKIVLEKIVGELKALDNPVVIEGHTDARQYSHGANYSNWELSADRGNVVRRLMIDMGLPEKQFSEVRAYADQKPLPGADPLDERNRRISILVKIQMEPESQAPKIPDISKGTDETSKRANGQLSDAIDSILTQ